MMNKLINIFLKKLFFFLTFFFLKELLVAFPWSPYFYVILFPFSFFMDGFPLPFDLNLPPDPDPDPDPDVYHPLMDDNDRREELENQLRTNFFVRDVTTATPEMIDRAVSAQLEIEKAVERTLLDEHYSAQSILAKRNSIRGFLFYPNGKLLHQRTYNQYIQEIQNEGTQESTPYQRVLQAIQSSHLLLDRTDGRLF